MAFRELLVFMIIGVSGTNIALNKPTYSSTIYPEPNVNPGPGKAVDGNHDDNWAHTSCFGSAHEDMEPWWMVDLLDDYTIHNITIKNRGDYYGERLHDFKIEIFKTNPVRCPQAVGQLCLQYDGQFGSLETLTCDSTVTGRFLKLYKFDMVDQYDTLMICELEVEASKQVPGCNWVRYSRNPGVKLVSALASITMPLNVCAFTCHGSRSCVGFNYKKAAQACQLVADTDENDTQVVDAEFDLYRTPSC